jgi:DNA adenine methylase
VTATEAPSRPVMRYHGGKFLLADWICEHLPPHRVYTEAFGGAASVLLRKPRVYGEVLNDLDGEVVNVFRILQDPRQAAELERLLRVTPFARAEFEASYEPAFESVEQARRTITRSFMGFGSAAHNSDHKTGFRANSNRSGTTPAQDWAHYPEALAFFTGRLQGVVIECRPAAEVIEQHDGAEVLHYVDPPYPHETRRFKARKTGQVYRHELTDADHRTLATVLRAVTGMVVLSGYACPLYDEELFPDWHRVTRRALADGAREREEVLWLSPRAWEALQTGRAQGSLW